MRWPLSCWTCSLLAGLALAISAHGQQANSRVNNEGIQYFQFVLRERGFTALRGIDRIAEPSQTIVILLGSFNPLSRLPEGLSSFLEQGGALLAASDKAASISADRQLSTVAGAQVTGQTYICRLNWAGYRFRDAEFCPFVQPVPNDVCNVFGGQGIISGSRLQVATNLPSALRLERDLPNGISIIGRLPLRCGPANEEENPLRAALTAPQAFAVAGDVGKGRILVLADHSIFINEMLLPSDNDNLIFAANCLDWLSGDAERKQVLLVVNDQIITRFDVPLKSVDLPAGAERALLALFNERLGQVAERLVELSEEDTFNRAIFDRISSQQVYRAILLTLSIGLLTYVMYRVAMRPRYRLDPGMPRLDRVLAPHLPEQAVLEQRQQALLRGGNLWEAAHAIARQGFATIGYPIGDRANGDPPRVEMQGGWWSRRRMAGRVQRLWRLAASPAPTRVSPAECRRLTREMDELQEAVARGTVRLVGKAP